MSDLRLRQLERAAMAGDPEAQECWKRAKAKTLGRSIACPHCPLTSDMCYDYQDEPPYARIEGSGRPGLATPRTFNRARNVAYRRRVEAKGVSLGGISHCVENDPPCEWCGA